MTTAINDEVADLRRADADLRRQLDEALAQRDEAVQRETATAEVLQVINSSPGNLAPVFAAILERALTLCDAVFGALFIRDGERFHAAAVHGLSSRFAEILGQPFTLDPDSTAQRLVRGEAVVHVEDISELPASESRQRQDLIQLGGARTFLQVALRKDNLLLGFLSIYRQEVRPFSNTQIALLQSFAAQAVIAMENARLINETREGLEQQTATAEVLAVINSSPGDLGPVFDAMLEKATRLCEAPFGILRTWDGERFHFGAVHGDPRFCDWVRQRGPIRTDSDASLLGRIQAGERVVHITDARNDEAYRASAGFREMAAASSIRSAITVTLHKHDVLLGIITVYRQEVRPFSDKQIALLQNFAAQAVIAMENARLITETREALEQQTATAEVLQVINSSPGDLTPVFDAMLDKALTLCDAAYGNLLSYDGECFHPAAVHGDSRLTAWLPRYGSFRPGPGTTNYKIVAGEEIVHVPDVIDDAPYRNGDPIRRALVEIGKCRALLSVALRKDNVLLGVIHVYRTEPRPFSENQIALLQNFAAQAVIAMENARLLTETREALEQQTATAEVLAVINSSPGDLAPVFEAILEKAHSLCGITIGALEVWDGKRVRALATRGLPQGFDDLIRQGYQPEPNDPHWALVNGEGFVHVPNLGAIDDPTSRSAAAVVGTGTFLAVALRKDSTLLGRIVAARQEVRPFAEREIALLENFAAQAVIAIENARLLTETQEALEQQTATAEVLQVINSSPGDLSSVFKSILEKSARLCSAESGIFWVYQGDGFRPAAWHGVTEEFSRFLHERSNIWATQFLDLIEGGEAFTHTMDLAETHTATTNLLSRAVVDLEHARTGLLVPLRKDELLIGAIRLYRHEVRPFSDKQVALLQNFAAQAVIAMENARLITETREALQQQTATADVLGVINSSPGDLAPVFDSILEKAHSLCGVTYGSLQVYDGERFRAVAVRGLPEALAHSLRQGYRGSDTPASRPIVEGERIVQITDLGEVDHPMARRAVELAGMRTLLSVALHKDDALLGMIIAGRKEVRPFAEKEIALLQNFAAQAVIAMENARLLTETREALEQQTATAEVLQVINSSPGDLAPVFDSMLEKAVRLCDGVNGILWTFEGKRARLAASRNMLPAAVEMLRRQGESGNHPMVQRVIAGDHLFQFDLAENEAYRSGEIAAAAATVIASGVRTIIWVALVKDGAAVGVFVISRQEVRPFSDKQIAVLQNFAAQAVIAMENARLLDEIRQRQQELRVTFDNMVDGVAMFDTELRLAAWNRNFQELLDLSDEFLSEPHGFDEYIRYLTVRGEFGQSDPETEIRRLRERLREHYRFERTRPDGKIIEVRHNPMPDGGVVLIYGDITERKRSEAEIRSARDAAEAAYRDLKAAQASLVQAEKMASLGQLTAGIAHEIKNPLNFVNNFAGLSVELLDELKETAAPAITALDEDKRAEIDETIEMLTGNLEKIAEHGRRADNIVKSMLEHSRSSSGERRSVDLNGLIEDALNLAYHGGRAQDQNFNVTLEREYAAALPPIELVPQDITRVCLNLFTNGFYATTKRQREGGDPSFKPTLKVLTRDLGEAVEVRIRDNGVGIPPEIKDKLFQPFFTTKPTGEGTGLGLSISYDIVTQQHGGTIEVDSRVGEYTEFTIRLPRAYRTTMAEAAS